MSAQLRLYPRGFLGGDLQPQIERTPKPFGEPLAQQTYRVTDYKTGTNGLVANPHIEAIYAQYIKQSANTGSFEFRKQIIQLALVSFGTLRFDIWFAAQYRSPSAGDLHNRFLIDTLRFIMRGRRDMSLETWGSLLTITDEGDKIGKMPPEAIKYFGMIQNGVLQNTESNMFLIDVLQQWCSKPNGLEDLLGTMHILFGNA